MKHNSDFRYDLEIGELKEIELAKILSNSTVEVKTDFIAKKTGNVIVEYQSTGKASGMSTSESDYYCFCIDESFIIIPSKELKQRCRKYIGTDRDVLGGDSNTSKGILLPVTELI